MLLFQHIPHVGLDWFGVEYIEFHESENLDHEMLNYSRTSIGSCSIQPAFSMRLYYQLILIHFWKVFSMKKPLSRNIMVNNILLFVHIKPFTTVWNPTYPCNLYDVHGSKTNIVFCRLNWTCLKSNVFELTLLIIKFPINYTRKSFGIFMLLSTNMKELLFFHFYRNFGIPTCQSNENILYR